MSDIQAIQRETRLDRVFRHRFGLAALAWMTALLVLAGQWYYHHVYMEQPVSDHEFQALGDEVIENEAARMALLRATAGNPHPTRRQWEIVVSYVRGVKGATGEGATP